MGVGKQKKIISKAKGILNSCKELIELNSEQNKEDSIENLKLVDLESSINLNLECFETCHKYDKKQAVEELKFILKDIDELIKTPIKES